MPTPAQNKLLELLGKYQPVEPEQAALKAVFMEFVAIYPDCCERHCVPGHLTGSAWLVSGDGQRAALMHHRKLGRWLQPGGHADGDADLAAVAQREAGEETGLTDLELSTEIYDLDRHEIPARGQEPAHWHYDMRFVVRANGSEVFVQNSESLALAWVEIAALAEREDVDESIQRMARKWLLES
jgi:8-oxo-dGTP pyrophosphatase MutT (NUDIX family)